jgi:multisubunit Na+/H+ antiporter MnhG subunit
MENEELETRVVVGVISLFLGIVCFILFLVAATFWTCNLALAFLITTVVSMFVADMAVVTDKEDNNTTVRRPSHCASCGAPMPKDSDTCCYCHSSYTEYQH